MPTRSATIRSTTSPTLPLAEEPRWRTNRSTARFMASEIFIDTSGFYALLVEKDNRHERADKFMKRAAAEKRRFVTTDYVVDETTTLLMARDLQRLVLPFFETLFASRACKVAWMDPE